MLYTVIKNGIDVYSCIALYLQNIWHVQHTDAQVSRNIIDNIKPETQGIQKGYISTHTHRRNHEATFKPR